MATATQDTSLKRDVSPLKGIYPIIAADIIYEGSMVGDNGSGYARPLVAGDPFLGHAFVQCDNATGAAGDLNVEVLKGTYMLEVTLSGVAITDSGRDVYASDDTTYTLTRGTNSPVGKVHRYVSSNTAMVEFHAGAGIQITSAIAMGSVATLTNSAAGAIDIGLGTIAGVAADNAFAVTVTDSSVFSSGYANMIYLNLTNSGAKTGGCAVSQLNAFAADVTLAAIANFNGIYIYVDDSGAPDLSSQAIAGANLDLQEMGATDYFTALWLQKSNTTKGTSIDAFILMSLQGSGVAKSAIYVQGINLPDNFLSLASAGAKDMLVDGTPTGSTKKYLKVDLGGTAYGIEVNSVA